MTFQTDENNLNNMVEYSVGVAKLAHYFYITRFLWHIINRNTPIGAYYMRHFINELRASLKTFLIFVPWQHLIARNDRELVS